MTSFPGQLVPLVTEFERKIDANRKGFTPEQVQVVLAAVSAFAEDFTDLTTERLLEPNIPPGVADLFCSSVREWWAYYNHPKSSNQVHSALHDFPFGDGAIVATLIAYERKYGPIWNPAKAKAAMKLKAKAS